MLNAIVYHISRMTFKIVLILFFRFKVEGRENIPKRGPFIIAGNHTSYMDPPIVGAVTRRRFHFIASDHLYKNKLMGWWIMAGGGIRVKKGESNHIAMRRILNYLKKGKPIAMFPEGTRSEDGKIKEPLSGIGFLALKSGVPVVPCLIKGSEKALPKGARSFKSSSVSVYVGKPIEAKDFKYEGDKKEAYRLFSRKIMNNIARLTRRYGD